MNQKRGWVRILEAVLAIMIISGILIFVYSRNVEQNDQSEYVYNLQRQILSQISSDDLLRAKVLEGDVSFLEDYISESVPSSLNFAIKICEADSEIYCNIEYVEGDVYVEEVFVSTNIDSPTFSPKKLRMFVWKK